MKKEKIIYRFSRYNGEVVQAKREIPFDLQLSSRLILDEICFTWNKAQLENKINHSIDTGNKASFLQLSQAYKHFVWE